MNKISRKNHLIDNKDLYILRKMAEDCIIKEGKQYSPVSLHKKENGAMNGVVKVPQSRRSSEYPKDGSAWNNIWCYKSTRGKSVRPERCFYFGIMSMMFNLLLMILIISLTAVRTNRRCPVPLTPDLADPCPNGWIGYQGKCYYFAMTERNWTSSSIHCSSHNASLAMVDSQEEKDFLLRYKTPPDHWIGLQKDSGQSWRWINGSIFKGWPNTGGGRRCAYLNHEVISSSSCTREERWICSRPAER